MNVKCLAVSFAIAAVMPASGICGELSFESSMMSKYVWRGVVVSGEPVMQPTVSAGYGKLSFNVWGNINLSDGQNYDVNLNEVDYTVDYAAVSGPVGISVGGIYYTFPNTGVGATTELFASLSIPSILNPSVTIYQDIQEAEGTYLSLGIAPSVPINAWNSSLDLALCLGFGSGRHNEFYYGAKGGALTDFFLGLSMPFSLSANTSLVPGIAFVNLLDSEIRGAQSSDDNLVVGLTFTAAF
ncbi:MAG: hypothetical protein FVQ81_04495 [Candidatus Glassbacteria bacterium]|nr:hypothetical protein [Candidatus Glassbacteria bacterium]